ncbi:RpiB/LacA/LacB family sugar-phosphate isomerase (plasmid) [Listeria seeligeri]|nr:ribose 5-phosphate isomerase [Listeria monocytogenes]QPJ28027.1 RpiB/LacA/LacB family sugar-phosphate isomerase [Listeria seeligeri]
MAISVSKLYSSKLSKEHNNTNILAFNSCVVGSELAKIIVSNWLDAEFDGGHHQKRINMIKDI